MATLKINQARNTMQQALTSTLLLLLVSGASAFSGHHQFAARRAADDSRPLARLNQQQLQQAASSQSEQVVMGKFRAPAPERIFKQRIARPSEYASQALTASYRVSDVDETAAADSMPEKIVHGIMGASSGETRSQQQQQQQQQPNSHQRVLSSKIQVSDEGLNYPPSKLSADIYGNVAEIVTAPPEAVESDFLLPVSTQTFGSRNVRG